MQGLGFEHVEELDHPLDSSPALQPPRSRRRALLLYILIGIALLWALIGWVIGPTMVRDAYATGNTSWIRALAPGDPQTLDDALAGWDEFAGRTLVGWLAVAALVWVMTSRAVARRVGRATPGTLGALRMAVCGILLASTFGERTQLVSAIPASERFGDTMGVMHALYALPLGMNELAGNPAALEALKALTIVFLAAATIGWRTRIVLPLVALCWFVLAGIVRSHLSFTHNGLVPFYLVAILCFTRCGDGFSLDRLLRIARGEPVVPADAKRAHYAWARYAIWTALVLFYVTAGVSKIRNGGWMWWDGRNIQAILYSGAFRGYGGDYPILSLGWMPLAVFSAIGLFAMATELGMAAVLVSARARIVMPVLALTMHVGIWVVQRIRFFDLMALQVIFYDWSRVRRWIGRRIEGRWGRLAVHLDARDPRADRMAALLRACDLFELLDVQLVHATTRVVPSRSKRALTGRSALTTLATAVPLLWPLALLLRVPLIGAVVYRACMRTWSRYGTVGDATAPAHLTPRGRRPFAWPLVIPALTAVLLGCCLLGVEAYPLTSMRMYSRSNRTGVVTYYRLLMVTPSGDVRPVHLHKFGGTAKRFNRPMWEAFAGGPEARARSTALLRYWGDDWNRSAEPAERAVSLQIQKRRWDFINDPDNPDHGHVVDKLTVRLHPPTRQVSVAR